MANQINSKRIAEKAAAPPLALVTRPCAQPMDCGKTKFELCGVAHLDKKVASSLKCGRIYLPLDWVGKRVKIIRLD